MSRPVVIRLKPGLSRDDADNDGTLFRPWGGAARPDFREVFIRHYDSIHSCRDALAGPGVAVTVMGPSGFEGSATIPARRECINVVTIGRHGHADLFLPQEPTMSLRQGAVIVYPQVEGRGVRFRVLDLRAACPFEDERGRRFEALETEGPVFLRSGAYALFVFPRESGSPSWSGSPEKVWGEMPERVYLQQAALEPGEGAEVERLSAGLPRGPATNSEATLILPLPGPFFEHEPLLKDNECPRGRLIVRSADGEMTLVLGKAAASRGVLLGRYERCDGSRLGVLSNPAISRVHALIIEIAGQLYAMDAGSTNGLWMGADRVPVASLVRGVRVALGPGIATLEWSYTH